MLLQRSSSTSHRDLPSRQLLASAALAAYVALAAPTLARADTRGGPSPAAASADLKAECLRAQAAEKWADLDACAERLTASEPALAKELKNRAVQETRSAPRAAGVEAALRDNNLKRAKAELDQVWTGSTSYRRVKDKYDAAEAAAVVDLVSRLERLKGGDCKEYNALLAQERAAKPLRVAAEAQRMVKCTPAAAAAARPSPSSPRPTCDAEALTDKGKEFFANGQYAAALTTFEAAISCRPDSTLFQKAFLTSCNLRNVAKAKQYWKRMSPAQRLQGSPACVRNGITEDDLNAP